MRLAILSLALALPAASSALPSTTPSTREPHRLGQQAVPSRFCGDEMKVRPIGSPDAARPKRLGELPPGDLTLTVVNRVGDCIEPMTVRQGTGPGGR